MVHGLVASLLDVLREAFTGEIAGVAEHVVAGPASAPAADALPRIVLSPGPFELESRVKDEATGQPRPQPTREELPVDETTPAGPYTLAQPPFEDSLRCRIVFDKDTRRERSLHLDAGRDFELDPAVPSITFSRDLTGADEIRLRYSHAGVFAARELRQEILVDVYAATPADVERYGSLITGILLLGQDELLADANRVTRTSYEVGRHATRHVFDRLALLGGDALELSGEIFHQRLNFRVTGRLEATRALEQPAARIEHVHSPGRISEPAVDIEPEVGG